MGYKYNAETGFWEAFYSKRHPVTRRPHCARRVRCKSEAEARRTERLLISQVEAKLHAKSVPKWKELIELYIEDCRFRGLSENTIHSTRVCVLAHTGDAWGARFSDSITRDEIIELHKNAVGDKSQGHQKYMMKCFRVIFKFAVDRGIILRSPVPIMKFRDGSKIMPVLNEEQVRKLLFKARELDDDWYYHWTVAVFTGMRNGELYALTWQNVNLDESLIYVKGGWDSKNGFKDYTKSGDDRVVSISPDLSIVLKELKLKSKGDFFVLPRLRAWDKGEQAIELRRFLVGIGLPRIRFHDLRASWATMLLGKGVEAIKVMNMGGWKDYKTMMIYIRKAGIDVRGGTDVLKLHDPEEQFGQVLKLADRNSL
jgi:integrase